MSFFLPLETQTAIFIFERVLFGVETTLNLVTFACLLKQTPPHQAIFSQVSHLHSGVTILLNANVGFSIVMCVIYRHQALLKPASPLKMSETALMLLRILSYSVLCLFPLLYILLPTDYAHIESAIDTFAHNVSWIRSRGVQYYFQATTETVVGLACALLAVLIIIVAFLVCAFLHMFYILKKDTIARSTQHLSKLHRSIQILFVQLAIPLFVVVCPGFVVFLGIATRDVISFGVCLTMFYITRLHSTVHNVSLLSLTSAYHDFLYSIITCRKQRSNLSTQIEWRGKLNPKQQA